MKPGGANFGQNGHFSVKIVEVHFQDCGVELGKVTLAAFTSTKQVKNWTNMKIVTSMWGPTPLAKSADSNGEWVPGKELSLPLAALRTATPMVCERPVPTWHSSSQLACLIGEAPRPPPPAQAASTPP